MVSPSARSNRASTTEAGEALILDLSPVGFQFYDNGRYRFSSTLNQGEAGSYFVQSNQLFTTDTLQQAPVEKKVQILHLSADSLRLKMQANDKERILTLVKSDRISSDSE